MEPVKKVTIEIRKPHLLNTTGVNVSAQTMRNRLHDTGFWSRKSCTVFTQISAPPLISAPTTFPSRIDNSRPHWARSANRYIEYETIERLNWTVRWPDTNPIEHVLNMLEVAASHHNPQPHGLLDHGVALSTEELINRAQRSIQTLIRSIDKSLSGYSGHARYYNLIVLQYEQIA